MAVIDKVGVGSMREWIESHAGTLLHEKKTGLLGVAIARKDGGPLDKNASPLSLTGYVRKRLTENQLGKRGIYTFKQAIAHASGSASEAEEFELNIVECGSDFRAQAETPPGSGSPAHVKDLRMGISITNPHRGYPSALSAGTLGFFIEVDGHQFLVTNNHVIADKNSARVGEAVVQPGTLDLSNGDRTAMPTIKALAAANRIASFVACKPLLFHDDKGILYNEVDLAVARLERHPARRYQHLPLFGKTERLQGVAPPYEFDEDGGLKGSGLVYKVGRTTGLTEGQLMAVDFYGDVNYGKRAARFRNQLVIESNPADGAPFSKPGDSGSAVMNADHELVGLLFGGSENQTQANPIHLVLSAIAEILSAKNPRVVTA